MRRTQTVVTVLKSVNASVAALDRRGSTIPTGRQRLPPSPDGGDGDGKFPAAGSRADAEGAAGVHRTATHDWKGEEVRLGGQIENEDRRRLDVDAAAEEDTEFRDGALGGLDLVTTNIRRLATSSSSSFAGLAELYPNCTMWFEVAFGSKIGDNYCDSIFNKAECGYDGGDCCECDCGLQLLDSSFSTNFTCGVNSYNCLDPSSSCFEDLYPDCVARGGTLEWIGTGACAIENNNEECGYDGGDCCECDCVGNLENRCGVNGFDCRDPSSPLECPEEVPTPSPETQSPTMSPVRITASPVSTTPTVTAEGDGGSDDSIAMEIVIGVASTVVGGVVLALVTKHCLGERGSSSSSG